MERSEFRECLVVEWWVIIRLTLHGVLRKLGIGEWTSFPSDTAITLVISGRHETQVVHHHYDLSNIILQVPQGVKVQKVNPYPLKYAEFDLSLPK
jgi:hypothetical protein